MADISQLSEDDFNVAFQSIRAKILEDPIEYFVKAPGFIDLKPTPGQIVLLKSIFGKELDSETKHKVHVETKDSEGKFDLHWVDFTETELYEYFTGFKYEYTGKTYNKLNMIMGRRGSKSTMASIISIFSAIKTNWNPYLAKTPVATVAVLSHSVEFSQEILDIIRNMVDESPVLSRLRDKGRKNTQSTFHLKVPFIKENGEVEYSCVAIKVGAASKKTTRGRAVCTLLTDEICWWQLDSASTESDVDILRAVRPALLQFGEHGTTIKLSSPAIKAGVLYEEWERREELKDEYIQMKAPSWMMNTILPASEFKNEHRLDPDGFNVEFRASFVDSISNFILPEFVDMCVLPQIKFQPPSEKNDVVYTAAIDAAFKSDRFAFSLVGYNGHRFTHHVQKWWEGSKVNPVQINEVAVYIRGICKSFGISEIIADQFAFQPLKEIFDQYGMTLVENTFSPAYKRKIYYGLKRVIHNQHIDLLDIPLVHKEIKELQVEQTPTGQIKISHPQSGSDDQADALAVACFGAMEKLTGGTLTMAEVGAMTDYNIPTDVNGKAFSAPAPEMLKSYPGYEEVFDNSAEYVKDPETGKIVHYSELEDELDDDSGPNFLF